MNLKEIYENKYKYEGLQEFNSYARNRLLEKVFIRYARPNLRILDLCCNDGVIANYFQEKGCNVACFDISERALDMAKSRGLGETYCGNAQEPLPFHHSSFDIVWWGDNVEHLFEPLKALHEICRILTPNGLLLLSTPNMGWIANRVYYLLTGMIRKTEGHNNSPWEWEHIRFFNRKVMESFLKQGGFKMEEFWACDQRRILNYLANFWPSFIGSVMLVAARKQ